MNELLVGIYGTGDFTSQLRFFSQRRPVNDPLSYTDAQPRQRSQVSKSATALRWGISGTGIGSFLNLTHSRSANTTTMFRSASISSLRAPLNIMPIMWFFACSGQSMPNSAAMTTWPVSRPSRISLKEKI